MTAGFWIAGALALAAPSAPAQDFDRDDRAEIIVPITPSGTTTITPGAELAPSTARHLVTPVPTLPPGEPDVISEQAISVRISDLVEIEGVRDNQLQGLGLVVGLAGTGDKGNAARQALSNFIKRNQLNVDAADVDIGNVALVTVTCTLKRWAKAGTTTDVTVQSVNGASSLFGGTLLQTPLFAADGDVYVVAQGPVPVGGLAAAGKAASVTVNHPTVGRITGGGIVEKEVPMHLLGTDGAMHLHLRTPSYVTAMRVAGEIARAFKVPARALDAMTIRVLLAPEQREDAVGFVAALADHSIEPGEEAVVVVNERTGTVVAGAHVRISTVAVTHGNLTISIAESEQISQPLPFSDGQTAAVDRTDVTTQVDQRGLQVLQGGTSVAQLATSLNRMGVSPRDLVAIFQALSQAGALHARLEIL
jgi:flagellar P-ring protein precursor FlgI